MKTNENCKINYKIKKSKRAKRMRIVVSCEGAVSVIVPWRVSDWRVEKIIREKTDWILTAIMKQQKLKKIKMPEDVAQTSYHATRARAKKQIISRLEHYNQYYNLEYERVSIKRQKTRWGSCSESRNLNFNYKIFFLPENLADYIIVHELCHLQELNHSKDFWDLVAQTIPDHRKRRSELKQIKF